VGVLPTELAKTVLRTCTGGTVDTCPEDWNDEDVRALCESYIAQVCLGDTVYRNDYCGICNNNGSFQGLACSTFNNRSAFGESSSESEDEDTWLDTDLEATSPASEHKDTSYYTDLEDILPESEQENTRFNISSEDILPGLRSVEVSFGSGHRKSPSDFTVLLDWHPQRKRATCQQYTKQYDPFKKTCRTAFLETESKCKFSSFDLTFFVLLFH
jgi:hypothetical protein